MMIITKKALSRRTALQGMGAMVALPFLDAMVPALTPLARTAAAPIPRLGFVYAPNGMFLPNFHPAGEGGHDYAMTPILRPLEAYREQMVVATGLSNRGLVSSREGGGVHTRAHCGWLSGHPGRQDDRPVCSRRAGCRYLATIARADHRVELDRRQL